MKIEFRTDTAMMEKPFQYFERFNESLKNLSVFTIKKSKNFKKKNKTFKID